MGCGVSKSPTIDTTSVQRPTKDTNNNTINVNNSNKSNNILPRRKDKNRSSVNRSNNNNNNTIPESSEATGATSPTVQFNVTSSTNTQHHQDSNFIAPPGTPHPKGRLLTRQLSRIDEAYSESISTPTTAPSTSSSPVGVITYDSIACQTEYNRSSVMTQTDPLPTPEEELEMLINCEYDFPETFRPSLDSGQGSSINGLPINNPNISNIHNQSSDTNHCDASIMVMIPARSNLTGLFEDFEISKRLVTPESRLVDVAIQVVQARTSCSTQTNFGGRGSSNGKPDSGVMKDSDQLEQPVNPFKAEDEAEVEEGNRLFHRLPIGLPVSNQQRSTSPTTMWAEVCSNNNQNRESSNGDVHRNIVSDVLTNNPQQTGIININSTPKCHDFESQTDPVNEVLAANAGDNDLNVLQSFILSSPFSHIEKQLGVDLGERSSNSNVINNNKTSDRSADGKLQECLNKLLDDIEDSFNFDTNRKGERKDASVQTVNDPITDEAPEFAARPPPSRKKEMIPTISIFEEVDAKALEVPETETSSLVSLVNYLIRNLPNDLFKVRGIFRWIAHNIKYNWNYMGISLSSEEIMKSREGVCKDYCQLFGDMCSMAGIRVKKIQGFAKGYDYRPGHQFVPGEDITHNWNAVFILGSWRFIDLTWGTGYTDHSGKFQRKLNEHFFLTDPETMIWTHFPYNQLEDNYSRWQLLDKPLSLEDFNTLPKVTPYFFEFNLKIRSKLSNPISFRVQTEIKIGGHEAMRYKYKLYPADEVENSSLNHYVFCQLKEDRMVGSFLVTPPIEGRYFLKVYARPEKDMAEWSLDATTVLPPATSTSTGQSSLSNLHSCVTFLLECSRSRKYLQPYPLNELPWGPTQSFYNYKMRLLNQNGPVVTTWGGKRRLILESSEPMLITYQVQDAEGMEMDAKNLLIREDNGNKITFIISPPRLGMFKLMIFGMPKPKQKGKWRLPLLATFLIECKMAKITKQLPEEEDPPPIVVDYVEPSMEYDVYKQKFTRPIIK